MKKGQLFLRLAIPGTLLAMFAVSYPARVPVVAQLTNQSRTGHKLPTITVLPKFPGIPLYASLLSEEKKQELIQTLINNKVSTWTASSPRSYRVGKFTSRGIFDGFLPTEDQIARIAPNYDNILFGAKNQELVLPFKKI